MTEVVLVSSSFWPQSDREYGIGRHAGRSVYISDCLYPELQRRGVRPGDSFKAVLFPVKKRSNIFQLAVESLLD